VTEDPAAIRLPSLKCDIELDYRAHMNAKARSVLNDALTLPREEQLALAERLLAAHQLDQNDISPEFMAELDARFRAFEQSEDDGEDAFEALEKMRGDLKARRGV